jgi:hypothetical protein
MYNDTAEARRGDVNVVHTGWMGKGVTWLHETSEKSGSGGLVYRYRRYIKFIPAITHLMFAS